MRVRELRGHEPIVRGLWRAAAERRLPHALLFEGPSGIGKHAAAVRLVQGLLCASGPGPPCGACGPCKRVQSGGWRGNHPDLYRIDPVEEETETIKLARVAIREGDEDCAEAFLRLRPVEGGWRAVLVREAHRAQAAAQNAFLKTLEEPSPGTLLVLETARPEVLLDTIRSRCVRVRFEPLSMDDTLAVLSEEGLAGDEAHLLARWSGGAPGRALVLAREAAPALRGLLVDALAGRAPALELAKAVWELDGEFAGSTPRAKARRRARAALEIALELVSDAVRCGAGLAPDALRHGDLVDTVGALPAARSEALGRRQREALLGLTADLAANVSPEAVVDRCLLALADGDALPSAL